MDASVLNRDFPKGSNYYETNNHMCNSCSRRRRLRLGARRRQDLYLSKCATCHGADGAGKTAMGKKLKVQNAQAAVGKMSADEMIKVVTDGKGQDMSGYGKQFSAEQIKGLVDYYRGLGK